MLCPEVWNFPLPKVITSHKENLNLESIKNYINNNYFYKSLIITCPDEIQTPSSILESEVEDTDYYKLTNCPLTELVEPIFVESFIKGGKVYCLSANRNCITQNCAAITPEGQLILHIPDFVFQTLGFEGTKRPHNYYEVNIDLKTIQNYEKTRIRLQKLELFDFYITWEPDNNEICPSSIAKYFHDRSIKISVHSLTIKSLSPSVDQIPVLKDVDAEEIVEWIGLLACEADLTPTESYICNYTPPESENSMKTSRISLSMAKGFITPVILNNICEKLAEYVSTRESANYWASLSLQSDENCLWQWKPSSPRMFQAQNSSCSIFFSQQGNNNMLYSIGELKYS